MVQTNRSANRIGARNSEREVRCFRKRPNELCVFPGGRLRNIALCAGVMLPDGIVKSGIRGMLLLKPTATGTQDETAAAAGPVAATPQNVCAIKSESVF